MSNGYVDSYYADTQVAAPHRPQLKGSRQADVCVIGAGLAGLTCALELAKAGREVILLEAERVPSPASGRNGGFVSPGYAEKLDNIIRKVGLHQARELFDLSREGARYVANAIVEHAMQGVDPVPGYLHVRRSDGEKEFLNLQNRLARDFNYPIQVWDTDKVRASLRTTRYFQGWYEETDAFHMHPLNYALELARVAEAAGVGICEHSAVTGMIEDVTGHIVQTQAGSVSAGDVVFCTSAYMAGGVFDPVSRAVLPVATYVVASEPLGARLAEAIGTRAAIVDTRRSSDYYRRLEDGRLLWGGRITTRRDVPRALSNRMVGDITSVYPQLAGIRIESAWAGLLGYAIHKMPLIGPPRPHVWVATAFGGHGLNSTATGGMLIAAAIAGGDDRYRLFEPFGMPWAGGAAGRLATQLAYWKMQLSDAVQERLAG